MRADAPSIEDMLDCVRVLRAIEADRSLLTRLTGDERRELLTLAGLVAKPERRDLVRMARAFRRAEREATQRHDRAIVDAAGLRVQRRSAQYSPLWLAPPKPDEAETQGAAADHAHGVLKKGLSCYVCKRLYTRVHRYYDSLCEECGEFNYAKRLQTANLAGHYALVTGARVKIGYQASLKLLRAGAHVIVTTRFPIDAADRYSSEFDYADFKPRLKIHGLDLRHTPSVELFARFLVERLPRLDYILNNACQTVRRPHGFFQHLLEREAEPTFKLAAPLRDCLADHDEFRSKLQGNTALSQRRQLDEDFSSDALFPRGRYDEDRQQVDLREVNSWRLRLHEVETPELLEVHLVNAVAPYVLNARLKPLMLRTPGRHKHIVNVSAMEGQFYRTTKTDKHPHTNMAKAALNMMTRTSAADYVRDDIHMNAVDTGWVTDEDPAVHAARKAESGFSPPLDIIDGASRIVDPIFAGHNTGVHVWGQFLKDYKPAPW